MSEEPEWLNAQREQQRKSLNLMQGTFVGAAVLPLILTPVVAFGRALGALGIALYLATAAMAIFDLAKRFTSRGEPLRYMAIMLVIVCGFLGLMFAPIALI
ncbi:hypothetical protein [Sphingomonas crocodyli]|uniref:Uncharacterized protein n=1 Tax=Sphingomonas crocodyli TaxID=1979270 RepID=A0A437LUU8_9SPHN|nr:hypothetical protein [Sphingomonas crocodyli]RVT89205.1 hypothetical protein EOD43_23120 [Sphingomonas crocodyli]